MAIAVDHLDAAQVAALADRLRADHGHIDVLVNDVWGAELLHGGPPNWDRPIWEVDLDGGLRMLRLGIDTHLITSHHLLPLLVDRPGGLVAEITDGTWAYNAEHYRISAFYDLAKVSVNRLAWSQGHELAPFGGTALAVTPGWMRSEMMLEHYATDEAHWREAETPPGFDQSETPRFVGRAIAAVAADPDRCPLEPGVGDVRRPVPGVRVHRRRRHPARRLGRALSHRGVYGRRAWTRPST